MIEQDKLKQVIHEAIQPYLVRAILGGFETAILKALAKEGVVLKVGNELPHYYHDIMDTTSKSIAEYHRELTNVSCGLFQPLIEEG